MITDPIADLICQIKNASTKSKEKVDIPASNVKEEIAKILKEEGYISNYKRLDDKKQGILRIFLKYAQDKRSMITDIKRVSKPSIRIYKKVDKLPRVLRGIGIAIISTSRGLMTDTKAREEHLGGEVVCYVW
ncbi:MAG: 30S ribosomal protein S8 [Elusimicrobia bacterium RIFOXYD2_FULL_34_15]|nr:MAG: 30S ribosomal protein S8 [Elusimicrobia bacterium RIFOXYD2_FULL_34_15]